MNGKTKSIDMLHGPLTGKLIRFALPIAASSMLQQLFNAADTAVVGRFANADALAAVGTNCEIVALIVSLSAGLSVGANVLLAGMIGAGKRENMQDAVYTAILLSFVVGMAGMGLGLLAARPLLVLIKTPKPILELAVLYLKIYLLGYPMLLVYDFGAAILRAKGDSRRPFVILAISGVLNVLLNLLFVIGCRMGVAGVAAATDLSTACAAGMVLLVLKREEQEFRLTFRKRNSSAAFLGKILKIGIPAALQGAVFCLANIFVQAAVNSFGEIAVAGSAIAMNFEYFGFYMITAFGQTATTFASQNYGAGNRKRCAQILIRCMVAAILFGAFVTLPLTVFRTQAAAAFSTDMRVVEAAGERIMLILLFEPICGFYEAPAGVLRGMGHSATPAVLTILGTCLLRIAWVEVAFRNMQTLSSLFIVFPISWVVTAVFMWTAYLVIVTRN